MAVFGKRSEAGGDEVADYLRIPLGTRFATTPDGKIALSFAGDMSFGESLPEIGELVCGRNLSLDPGVTIRAESVKVKAGLELGAGARLLTQRIETGTLAAEKAEVEAKDIQAISLELKESQLTAGLITAKESVYADRGEIEVGTVKTQNLTLTKGTRSSIQVAAVNKSEGQVSQGGYGSYQEFLAKVFIYHPEILSEKARTEAARIVEQDKGRLKTVQGLVQGTAGSTGSAPASSESAKESDEAETETSDSGSAADPRLEEQAGRLLNFYQGRETPKEVTELLDYAKSGNRAELRRRLNPIYQRLAAQGKIPDPVMETFLELQKILKDDAGARKPAGSVA
jgi:hypothetical protein